MRPETEAVWCVPSGAGIRGQLPLAKKNPSGFAAFGYPDVVANYRRLAMSKRADAVFVTLKRRGLTDRHIEILLRAIAGIPRDWSAGNESWKQVQKRRARMAKRLRALASEVSTDPDLNRLSFGFGAAAYNEMDGNIEGLQTLASLLEMAAVSLEPSDTLRVKTSDGTLLTAAEYDRTSRPERKLPLQSYTLHAIFELLEPHFARAPNRETETLGSILLRKPIKPGTVTHLRKSTRRRYPGG